ncbi:hypothetical protein H0H87_006990 [Tephrocybe sp. NHM501043]|nr:hypothetical protein H0H87_006990 [Tephrocybe sp. NHM501043]
MRTQVFAAYRHPGPTITLRLHGTTFIRTSTMSVSIRIATAFVMTLLVQLAATSPAQSESAHHPSKHAKWMWTRQIRHENSQNASRPSIHVRADPPYHLPPVSDVFKMVATGGVKQQKDGSPTVTPQVLAPTSSPSLSSVVTDPSAPTTIPPADAIAPTTTIEQPISQASYLGTGLVNPSTTVHPDADRPEASAVTSDTTLPSGSSISFQNPSNTLSVVPSQPTFMPNAHPTGTGPILDAAQPTASTSPHHKVTKPTHKLIVIAILLAGLIASMLLAFIIVDRRLFAVCRRNKKEEPDTWKKIDSPPPAGTYYGVEKQIDYQPLTCEPRTTYQPPSYQAQVYQPQVYEPQSPHSQRSASSVYSSHGTCEASTPGPSTPLAYGTPVGDVMDINTNYPRSKFSLCSSEYPVSISSESYAHSDDSAYAPMSRGPTDSGLRPTYQFFCQPPETFDDRPQSRALSLPVAPANVQGAPELMVRPLHYRRSRSISGLAYTVNPRERRDSGAGNGSTRGSSGWPSGM